jgi:hypothetical protein
MSRTAAIALAVTKSAVFYGVFGLIASELVALNFTILPGFQNTAVSKGV